MRTLLSILYILMGVIAFVAIILMDEPLWAAFPLGWSCGASIGYGVRLLIEDYDA